MNKISQEVIKYLSSLTLKHNDCIVFDIDETLIDLNGNTIKPIMDIYYYAIDKNCCVSLITARTGVLDVVEYTTKQLKQNNINHYKYLYLRPPDKDPFIYKQNARKSLVDKGYNVIMSLGDQLFDIGKYGGKGILLPKLQY